jgi:LytTr DNA-binding domain
MNFINKEYSKYDPYNRIWKNGLLSAIIVLLIFILFQPFGFKDKDTELKLVLFPGYALFAYMHSFFNFHLVRYILKKKKAWTLADELLNFLISMVLLTIVIHLFTSWTTGDMPLTFKWYFKLLYHVASLFLVIGIIEFFYYNNKSTNYNNKQLSSHYEIAKQQLNDAKGQNKAVISISLEKEKIEINKNKILYIQSISNYLEFYLREPDGKINKITKRGRLHKVEKDLASFSEFFRCHRAFIINLNQSVQLKGNMKNARVVFEGEPEEIPVSRTLYKTLKEHIEKITLS